eukprot:2986103-Rhodomonas_salina.2
MRGRGTFCSCSTLSVMPIFLTMSVWACFLAASFWRASCSMCAARCCSASTTSADGIACPCLPCSSCDLREATNPSRGCDRGDDRLWELRQARSVQTDTVARALRAPAAVLWIVAPPQSAAASAQRQHSAAMTLLAGTAHCGPLPTSAACPVQEPQN